jgi:hypothetical protein
MSIEGMRALQDMEHFALREGETLILRFKTPPSHEMLENARRIVAHALPGAKVLVLPPDVEVYAGNIEVFGVDLAREEGPTQEDIEAARAEIKDAYEGGSTIYLNDASTGDDWVAMHKHYNPIAQWDWETTRYRLTPKKRASYSWPSATGTS